MAKQRTIMDNYYNIIGMNQAVQYARDLRKVGIKLRRVRKGFWKIVYISTTAPPMDGEDVYISQYVNERYRVAIPHRQWSLSFNPVEIQDPPTMWQRSFKYRFGIA